MGKGSKASVLGQGCVLAKIQAPDLTDLAELALGSALGKALLSKTGELTMCSWLALEERV